jgi:hypothetical protein
VENFFHAAEEFIILAGSLAILTIFIWKLICHEAGRDRSQPGPPEKIYVLVPCPSMTNDTAKLRASLRLAMATIRMMKVHQKVNTTEVLRILARTLKDAKEENEIPRRRLRGRL